MLVVLLLQLRAGVGNGIGAELFVPELPGQLVDCLLGPVLLQAGLLSCQRCDQQ